MKEEEKYRLIGYYGLFYLGLFLLALAIFSNFEMLPFLMLVMGLGLFSIFTTMVIFVMNHEAKSDVLSNPVISITPLIIAAVLSPLDDVLSQFYPIILVILIASIPAIIFVNFYSRDENKEKKKKFRKSKSLAKFGMQFLHLLVSPAFVVFTTIDVYLLLNQIHIFMGLENSVSPTVQFTAATLLTWAAIILVIPLLHACHAIKRKIKLKK